MIETVSYRYRELGAVFVDEWDASALDENKLATWWAERRPVGADRLSLDYWWRRSLRGASVEADVLARPAPPYACAGNAFARQKCWPAFRAASAASSTNHDEPRRGAAHLDVRRGAAHR